MYGIDHFFVAPGSRCTPLTLAVARQSNIHVIQHFDERGLAFAALGYGKATGKPGVFICTSGTAVANAYPAVIEAAMEKVPLLLFTADRPTELRGTGANQTIDQREIFGRYPNLFLNMPVPEDQVSEDDPDGEQFLSDALPPCFMAAQNGPVQVNWMFREPFTITEENNDLASLIHPQTDATQAGEAETVQIEVKGDVLIALGSCQPEEADEARKLASHLGCPILSDITSGLRTGSFELPSDFRLPKPDTVLHLGGRIVSKSWLQWTHSIRDSGTDFIHVTPNGQAINPNRLRQTQFQTPLTNLSSKVVGSSTSTDFFKTWQEAARMRDAVLEHELADTDHLSEPAIAFHLSQNCPASDGLFIGNSMPVRDLDQYGTKNGDQPRRVAANRGASGIDGLLATATGFAAGLKSATTVVVGDLSALHDLNSLSLIANSRWPMVVIIVNNFGGHIFDLLPIRESEHFERFFATPHTYRFEHAAEMFDLAYRRVTDMTGFKESYRDALSRSKSMVLEVATNRQHNLDVRQQIRKEIAKCRSQD